MLVIAISYGIMGDPFTCSATSNDTIFPIGDSCQDYLDFICQVQNLATGMRKEIDEILVIGVEHNRKSITGTPFMTEELAVPVVLHHFGSDDGLGEQDNDIDNDD